MKAKRSGNSIVALVVIGVLVTVVVFVAWLLYFKPKMADVFYEPVFVNDVRKIQLVSGMRVNLNASVEAEKSAVMADTDEASVAYADQALGLSAAVEDARIELGMLIESEKMGREVDLFREFSTCWEKFRQIDQELLPMSVMNTNLKASQLSYVLAQNAVNHLEKSLDALIKSSDASDRSCRIERLSQRVLVAALKIHALQSPHIAEIRQEKMDEIEATIQSQDALINQTLDALSFLLNPKNRPLIEETKAVYAEFWRINTEMLQLSRQNTNVRSLVMSLGQKRNVTVQCQEALAALEKTIQSKAYKATR